MLGFVLMAVGVISLAYGILSTARMMSVFIPRIEEATSSQLASFFFASTPQAILWSTAFATFFASGIILQRMDSSGSDRQLDGLSGILKREEEPSGTGPVGNRKRTREADERVQAIKVEVLRAIQRLEMLDNPEDETRDS